MKNKRSLLPGVILLALGAVLMLAMFAMYGAAKAKQAKCTAETQAAVTAVESREVRKNLGSGKYVSTHLVTVYYPVYSFTIDGSEYSGKDEEAYDRDESAYAPGKQVTVHYQPDDPANSYIVPAPSMRTSVLWRPAAILLALGLGSTVSILKRNSKR